MPRTATQVKEPTPKQVAARAAGADRLRAAAAARVGTKQPVRSTRAFVETEEEEIGQNNVRNMRSTGRARDSLDPPMVHRVDKRPSKEKLDTLSFMEEIVTVIVHDSTNPTDDPHPVVWNSGIRQQFERGAEQKVKRKFVWVLANARKTTYSQEKYKDAQGAEAYRNIPHTALMYPFSVIDDSEKGKTELRKLLSQTA